MESESMEQPVQASPQKEETNTQESKPSDYDNVPATEVNASDQPDSSSNFTTSVEKEPETELVKCIFTDESRPDAIDGAVAVVQKVEYVPPIAAEVATLEDISQPPEASASVSAHEQSLEGEESTSVEGTGDRSDTSVTSVIAVPTNSRETQDASPCKVEPDEPTVTSSPTDVHLQSGLSVCLKVDKDSDLNEGGAVGPVLLLSGEHIEETVDQQQEHATFQHPVHAVTEQDDKPVGLEVTPGVVVEGDEVKIQSDLKISSTGSLEKAGKKSKRKSRLPFKLKRSKQTNEQGPKSGGSLDRSSMKSFGENVRNLFGTVRSSMKKKRKPVKQESKPPPVRPPRPPVMNGVWVKPRATSNDLDAQSLRSVSGPSITESPIVPRRKVVQEALPDFMAALPADSAETHAELNGRQLSEEANLSEKPTAHERESSPGAASVHEENIQPVSVRRHVTLTHKSDADRPQEEMHSPQTPNKGSMSPKPPRPYNRPALSPLDYQPYEPSLDGSCEPMEVNMHRADLVRASCQGGYGGGKDTPQVNMGTPRGYRETTYSLDRHQRDVPVRQSPNTLRKTQTLRIDFADRIRERVRSLRAEPSEDADASSTLSPRKGRTVKETYVCSDTVKWPKIHLKLKKKSSSVSKDAPRSVYEPMIHRPQPHINPYYQTNSLQRPPPPRGFSTEHISVSRADYVQSGLPAVARIHLNGPTTRASDGSGTPQSGRQLTSLLSVSAGAQTHQRSMLGEPAQKDRSHLLQANITSASHEEHSTVPYFSAELSEDAVAGTHKVDGADSEAERTAASSQQDRLNETIRRLQPFLDTWELLSTEEAERNTELQVQTKTTIQEFFKTCIRLRSVDLQGQFSPFHYPLPSFKEYYWIQCAKLRDWNNLQIMREPEWNTEYALLPLCGEGRLLFADRPVDILLANWLDCQHASPPAGEPYENVKLQTHSNPIFHPVQIVATLEQLLKSEPYEEETKSDLYHTALRLAVLLAFEYCSASDPKPNPRVEDILIILSSINCLVLFRQHSASESGEDQRGNFVRELCSSSTSSSDAIDTLIDRVHNIVTSRLNACYTAPSLLRAVAPPNWMAQLIARIYLKKM